MNRQKTVAALTRKKDTVKNKFFTNELVRFANIVLTPRFAGVGSMEEYFTDE